MKRICCFVVLVSMFSSCSYYIGKPKLAKGFTSSPYIKDRPFVTDLPHDFDTSNAIIKQFASTPLPPIDQVGRHDFIRTLIAKLVLHQDVQQMNDYIMQLKPWAKPGTDWALHKHADYDFAMIPWCILLYYFEKQPDLLYPKTAEHIAKDLLIHEKHWKAIRTPNTLGILRETENHILMGEISRYLQNQWLHEHGDILTIHDNAKNGMDKWMVSHMHEKVNGGMYEFNSNPYSGYSMAALLTLYSFAHNAKVQEQCGKVLDIIALEYAYGSIDQKRYPPFRRRLERASLKTFAEDPMTSYIKTWMALRDPNRFPFDANRGSFALNALLLKYRLTDDLFGMLGANKRQGYFVTIGHGYHGSPEIYSGGDGFLLSAGGVQRGQASQIVAHPTVLFQSNENQLDSCFYIPGKGEMKYWNNTGVYKNFACGPQPVHIPSSMKPVAENGNWKLFFSNHWIITYSDKDVGLIIVSDRLLTPDQAVNPEQQLKEIVVANQNRDLHKSCVTSNGDTISYNLKAPKGKWLIKTVNSKKLDRRYDKWVRINTNH